jgi:MSHA type pilus biogenesis protein MshL
MGEGIRRNPMKSKVFLILILCLLFAGGCASPPKKDRPKLQYQVTEPAQPQPPAKEKLEELVIPQREGMKKPPEKLYSFFARDANIHDVLLAFSRESELNIVTDPELSGKVTVDLKRVNLKEAFDAILTPLGLTYHIDEKFIKVLKPTMEMRLFTLNYVATKRSGKRETYASTTGNLPTSLRGITPSQQTTVATGMGARTGYSDLITVDEIDLWTEIQKGLEVIIFGSFEEEGKEVSTETNKTTWARTDGKGKKLIINKTAGVIMVTDYPLNLNRVASYIETIEGSSQRQVSIQAKILEVILSDEHKEGINWKVIQSLPRSINLAWGLTNKAGTLGFPGGDTGYVATGGGGGATAIATPGTFKINPFGGLFAIGAGGVDILLSDIMQAISEQGDLKVLSSPTISTLNNQKAIIRVGNQDVFFISGAVATETAVTQVYQPVTIDIGIILDVTPQISEDGTIIMNIHPSITEKTGEKDAPDGKSKFPLLSVRETDTTVKVKDGQTIIIAGLMQEKKEESYIGFPVLESVPLLGGLFRYKTGTKRNTELVIMITPTLQVGQKVEELTNK